METSRAFGNHGIGRPQIHSIPLSFCWNRSSPRPSLPWRPPSSALPELARPPPPPRFVATGDLSPSLSPTAGQILPTEILISLGRECPVPGDPPFTSSHQAPEVTDEKLRQSCSAYFLCHILPPINRDPAPNLAASKNREPAAGRVSSLIEPALFCCSDLDILAPALLLLGQRHLGSSSSPSYPTRMRFAIVHWLAPTPPLFGTHDDRERGGERERERAGTWEAGGGGL